MKSLRGFPHVVSLLSFICLSFSFVRFLQYVCFYLPSLCPSSCLSCIRSYILCSMCPSFLASIFPSLPYRLSFFPGSVFKECPLSCLTKCMVNFFIWYSNMNAKESRKLCMEISGIFMCRKSRNSALNSPFPSCVCDNELSSCMQWLRERTQILLHALQTASPELKWYKLRSLASLCCQELACVSTAAHVWCGRMWRTWRLVRKTAPTRSGQGSWRYRKQFFHPTVSQSLISTGRYCTVLFSSLLFMVQRIQECLHLQVESQLTQPPNKVSGLCCVMPVLLS